MMMNNRKLVNDDEYRKNKLMKDSKNMRIDETIKQIVSVCKKLAFKKLLHKV